MRGSRFVRTPEIEAAIVAAFRQGTPKKTLAKQFGTRITTIGDILRQSGMELPEHGNRIFTAQQEEEIVRRVKAGERYATIAKDFGCNIHTPWVIAKRHGVTRDPVAGPPRLSSYVVHDEAIRALAAEGYTQRQIASKLGINAKTLAGYMLKQGIKSPNNGRANKSVPSTQARLTHGCKGGRTSKGHGYINVRMNPQHAFADAMIGNDGYVLEHRLVMAEYLGRPLHDYETVHHINGDRTDNRIENLQLRISAHARGQAYQCADCGSFNIVPVQLKNPTEA